MTLEDLRQINNEPVKFLYFKMDDVGISVWVIHSVDSNALGYINDWMTSHNKEDDLALIDWMKIADVGEYYSHRLGYVVRVKAGTP